MSDSILLTLESPFCLLGAGREYSFPVEGPLTVREVCSLLAGSAPGTASLLPGGECAMFLLVTVGQKRLALEDLVQPGDNVHFSAPGFGG